MIKTNNMKFKTTMKRNIWKRKSLEFYIQDQFLLNNKQKKIKITKMNKQRKKTIVLIKLKKHLD